MMAILRAATRHKNLSRSLLRREKSFIQPAAFGCYRNTSNAAFGNHFAGNLIGEHDEDSDGDKLDKHADLSAQSDAYILLNRLDLGLQTGMITSVLMLENVKLLLKAGVTVPISFLFDSGSQSSSTTASSQSRAIALTTGATENISRPQ
jgi:hypothetical protein